MEFLVEWAFGALIVVVGPLLTLLDLPGNTIMLAAGIGYAFFDEARYFDGRLLSALVLVYAFGEIWEFIVSFFGIRRHKVSWGAVFLCCRYFYRRCHWHRLFPGAGLCFGRRSWFVYRCLRLRVYAYQE